MKNATMYIPGELMTAIKTLSRQSRYSEAESIRNALDEYVSSRKRPILSVLGMGTEGKITGAESEDWLKDNWRPA